MVDKAQKSICRPKPRGFDPLLAAGCVIGQGAIVGRFEEMRVAQPAPYHTLEICMHTVARPRFFVYVSTCTHRRDPNGACHVVMKLETDLRIYIYGAPAHGNLKTF